MRTFLWWLFVAVVCSPMALLLVVLAAARYPQLDRASTKMPAAMRAVAGEIAMRSVGFGKDAGQKLDRVLQLDPDNAAAWTRKCSASANDEKTAGKSQALSNCRKAVSLNPTEFNWNGLGLAQEGAGDFCHAEDSFTSANSKVNAADGFILRNLGRAALECGHVAAAVASFEVAETKDGQQAAVAGAEGGDEDDIAEARDDLRTDREWLVIAYNRNGEMKDAGAACANAHPGWKSCSCTSHSKEVKCEQPALPKP